MFPNVVALAGRKGSGKDTAAEALVERGYQVVKFADGLKWMLRILLKYRGVDDITIDRMIEGDLKEVPTRYLGHKTPRFSMQHLGTEWGRCGLDKNLWADATSDRVKQLDKVIITDMRFHNEVQAVKQLGGVAIRIVRPGLKNNEFSDHASEMEIDELKVDYIIQNSGTIEEMQTVLLAQLRHAEVGRMEYGKHKN